MSDRQIDDALEAWPDIKAPDENALAEKTMNRIRANFPPKSKLTLTDDALVTSPFPPSESDQTEQEHAWQTKSREHSSPDDTIEQAPLADVTPPVGIYVERHRESLIDKAELEDDSEVQNVDASELETTPENQTIDPFADATQEIRPSQPVNRPSHQARAQEPEQIRRPAEKSSPIDVPIARASSIPPPSSGVARSEKSAAPPQGREPSQKKAEGSMGQVERQRDRTSFKDLAKLAATPPPPSAKPSSAKVPVATPSSASGLKSSDSGVVDLQAAALSDPQGAERAKSTPLASGSLFDEEGPSSRRSSAPPPSMSGEHPSSGAMSAALSVPQQIDPYSPASVRPSAPPASVSAGRLSSAGPHSAVAAMAQQPARLGKDTESKSRVGIILASLVGVAAIAAGGLFYVHAHRAAPVTSAVATPVAANDSAPAQPQAAQNSDQTAAPVAATDTVSPNALPVDDPNLLAQNSATPGAKSAGKPFAHAAKSGGKPSIAKDSFLKTEADTPSPTPDTKAAPVATKDEAPPPVGGSANLQNAMQTAAGPSDSNATQAAPTGPKYAPGSVPQRPSQGALSSAIGRSLPDARACLGPDDGVSYATVIFESGGGVQNVTLSGFAANKPAGACIVTALKKASVGPFAEPTYSAKITVRP